MTLRFGPVSLLVCTVILSSCAPRGDVLDSRAFTTEVARAIQVAAPSLDVRQSAPLEIEIRNAGDQTWTFRLMSMYDDYKQRPAEKTRIVDSFVTRTLAYPPYAFVPLGNQVFPVVRRRAWLESFSPSSRGPTSTAGASAEQPIFDDFTAHWVILYKTTPDSPTYVTSSSLAEMRIDRVRLRSSAMLNLREAAHRIDIVPNANFAVVTTNSNVDPSLLLVDELWQGDRIKVDGEIVAAIVGSTGLLVSGSRNREGSADSGRSRGSGSTRGKPSRRCWFTVADVSSPSPSNDRRAQ